MTDEVAKRMADRANELGNTYLDIPFAPWESCGGKQQDWWREMARMSQYPEGERPKKAKK